VYGQTIVISGPTGCHPHPTRRVTIGVPPYLREGFGIPQRLCRAQDQSIRIKGKGGIGNLGVSVGYKMNTTYQFLAKVAKPPNFFIKKHLNI